MNHILLLAYPAALVIFTCFHARLTRGGRVSDGFLSLEQTHMIQAFACIGVILHHVTQQITAYGIYDKGPISLFNDIGILFTALFFFFSGYGLITSLQEKPGYLDSFLYRRLPTVLIPFWIINALGVLLETFGGGIHTTPAGALRDIFGLTLVNSNGWFFVEITIFYLFFYVTFRLVKNRNAALVLLCLAVLGIIIFSFHQGHDPQGDQSHWFRGEWWYNSTITFIFGLLYARFRQPLTRLLNRLWLLFLPVSFLLTALFLQRSIVCVRRGGYYEDMPSLYESAMSASGTLGAGRSEFSLSRFFDTLSRSILSPSGLFTTLAGHTLLWQSAACIAFTLMILLLSMRVTLGNRALRFVSTISRELFLIHGYFAFWIFGSVRMNDFLRYAVVLSTSIACTALLSWPVRRLVRAVVRLLSGAHASVSASFRAAARAKREETGAAAHAKRMRKGRILLLSGAVVPAAVLVLIPVFRNVKSNAEFQAEYEVLKTASVGDSVLFGRYETDPSKAGTEQLAWTVIQKDADRLCLLSMFGIAPGAYHKKHEAVTWEDCDLRRRLNSDEFPDMFSRQEKEILVPADSGTGQDLITLLSIHELEDAFPAKKERVCASTQSAVRQGVNADRLSHYDVWFDQQYCYSWWWLKQEEGQSSVTAPIVDMDGSVLKDQKPVNKPGGAIRPVVWVQVPLHP